MKVLFHCAISYPAGDPVDAVFVDGNGRKYTIPSMEPTEIESDYMADRIMEHCHYYGIVEVAQIRTKTGIQWDLKDARERAEQALLRSEKQCINDYVRMQLEARVKQNVPPLPPEGRALDCVVKHKYNLHKAGIHPVGWEPPYDMPEDSPAVQLKQSDIDARMAALENENEKLRGELREFMQAVLIGQQNQRKAKIQNQAEQG